MEVIKKLETVLFIEKTDVKGEKIEKRVIEDYKAIRGATEHQLKEFQQEFCIQLPAQVLDFYRYKNGSGLLSIICPKMGTPYRVLSLEEITRLKTFFQNMNKRMDEFEGYFTKEDIEQVDKRIQPYLFHKKWIPFATRDNSLYLMMDFVPSPKGTMGQIIKYIHDPEWVEFVAEDLDDVLHKSLKNIAWNYNSVLD